MNKQIPILMCHGEEDAVVAFRFGRATAKYLAKKGYSIQFNNYPGLAHAADPKEIADIGEFIAKCLPVISKL